MSATFKIVRVPIDPDQWLLVTDQTVWASVFCDFFQDGAMPHLREQIARNVIENIECVITTKVHYDALMAEANAQKAADRSCDTCAHNAGQACDATETDLCPVEMVRE